MVQTSTRGAVREKERLVAVDTICYMEGRCERWIHAQQGYHLWMHATSINSKPASEHGSSKGLNWKAKIDMRLPKSNQGGFALLGTLAILSAVECSGLGHSAHGLPKML